MKNLFFSFSFTTMLIFSGCGSSGSQPVKISSDAPSDTPSNSPIVSDIPNNLSVQFVDVSSPSDNLVYVNDSIDVNNMAIKDSQGNDVTDQYNIVVEGNVDSSTVGSYPIKINIFKDDKLVDSFDKVITVKENSKPFISLKGKDKISSLFGKDFVEPGFSASDVEDGDLTSSVVVTNDINKTKAGEYTVTYTVKDHRGASTSVSRTVEVLPNNAPVLSLKGEDTIHLFVGQDFVEPGFTASDVEDGDLTDKVKVSIEKLN